MKCETKVCKIIINEASSLNVVSKTVIARMNLTFEPHPRSFHIPWINDTTLLISERCLIHIQIGNHLACVWYDVLPMNIGHILLGFPWLQEMQVYHNMQNNTYILKSQGKSFKLLPTKPKSNISKPFTVNQSNPLPLIINKSPQEFDAKKLDLVSQISKKNLFKNVMLRN